MSNVETRQKLEAVMGFLNQEGSELLFDEGLPWEDAETMVSVEGGSRSTSLQELICL